MHRTTNKSKGEGVCAGAEEGTTDCSAEIAGEADCSAVAEVFGSGDSCASATTAKTIQNTTIRNPQFAIRDSNIVTPVHVGKKIVAPFAVTQEFLINIVCDQLIV